MSVTKFFKSKVLLKVLLLLCGLLLSGKNSLCQVSIKGRVADEQKNYMPSVTVVLLAPDSVLVTGDATDGAGAFVFNNVAPGHYTISASMVGYAKYFSESILVSDKDIYVPEIILEEAATELNEVVVKEGKQFLEQKIDRTVINIQNSITSSGSSVLEVLQKSPGVVVNRHDNTIGMNGKSNVRVMINDKLVPVPMDVVVQMLEGMSAANVEKIEVITTPPSQYDAEGSGGIIHIVTKRNEELGTSGSVGLTLGARWAETLGGNVNLSHRNKRAAYFVDYSIIRNHNLHILEISRQLSNEEFARMVEVHNHRENVTTQQNLSAGFEYNLGGNTFLNLGLTGYSRDWNMTAFVHDQNYAAIDSTLITNMNIRQSNVWQSVTGTVGLETKINSKNKINISLDYLYYHNDNPSVYENKVFYEQGNIDEPSKIDLQKKTPIHFYIGRVDYQYVKSASFSFEAGLKAVTSKFNNHVLVQRMVNDEWVLDPIFTSHSKLGETTGAIYFSTNWLPGKQWQLNGGLRYEYTYTRGDTPEKKLFNRSYGYLFPSLSLKKDLGNERDFQLAYSRRITRPTYNDIASYAAFWSANTFTAENISLRPAVSDAIRIGYHVKSWIISLQYNHVNNEITTLQPAVDRSSNILTYRSQNLKYLNTLGLSNSYSFNPAPWWEVQGNLTLQYQAAQTSHLQHNISFRLYGVNINVVNVLKLPKDFSIEISGVYQSRSASGISQYLASGSLNAGIQKNVGRNATIKLAMDDILYTNYWRLKTYSPENNLDIYFQYDWHNQFVRLTYTQKLGNNKLRSVRLKSGSEEERKRVGG